MKLTKEQRLAARRLVALARATWYMVDGTEGTTQKDEHGEKVYLVSAKEFDKVSKCLDALDKLPELPPPWIGEGPSKAEHALGISTKK